MNTSGRICLEDGIIVYDVPGDGWSVPLSNVRIIGEYTNSDGPFWDDYFFVFLTAPQDGWYQASFFAEGRDAFLSKLSAELGSPIKTGLCSSADFKTRILWPPAISGEPLMQVVPKPSTRGRLWAKFTGRQDVELSDTARAVFTHEEAEQEAGGEAINPAP